MEERDYFNRTESLQKAYERGVVSREDYMRFLHDEEAWRQRHRQ